jgi:membrane-associated protein
MGGLINFVLHIDKYISVIIQNSGNWTYMILLIIIFCETGLVVTPFLPGDSLLFAAGAFASNGLLDIKVLFLAFIIAAFLGDTVNYQIGHYIGPKAFKSNSKLLKKEYLDRAHRFYEKHGGKTIIIARFMPIIRTFAPFVAGIGNMGYSKFITYNLTGSALWVSLVVFAGYFFGNIPFIKNNFSIVVYVIIFISVLPGIIGLLRGTRVKENA